MKYFSVRCTIAILCYLKCFMFPMLHLVKVISKRFWTFSKAQSGIYFPQYRYPYLPCRNIYPVSEAICCRNRQSVVLQMLLNCHPTLYSICVHGVKTDQRHKAALHLHLAFHSFALICLSFVTYKLNIFFLVFST